MNALNVRRVVGDSILGTADFGPEYPQIEIGKAAPALRKMEDVDGMSRAGFLDRSTPVEINLLNAQRLRNRMRTLSIAGYTGPTWLEPERMVKARPSVGSIPAEVMANSNHAGVYAMTRVAGSRTYDVGLLWLKDPADFDNLCRLMTAKTGDDRRRVPHVPMVSDLEFVVRLNQSQLYPKWIFELVNNAQLLGVNQVAPPVPPINPEWADSARAQTDVNFSVRREWQRYVGLRPIGLLYSLHVLPSALDHPPLLGEALRGFQEAVRGDNPYYGVHISFTDISRANKNGDRIRLAKDFVNRAAGIAGAEGLFTWVADVGPVGPVFLDQGASFTSYHPGMTPKRVYADGRTDDEEDKYGKALGLFTYELLDRPQVRARHWVMEDTSLFPNVVPLHLRGDNVFTAYRKEWAKPQNIAVQEWINNDRTRMLHVGDAKPGSSHIGKSADPRIGAWGH